MKTMKTTSKYWLFIIAMTGILIGSNQSNAQDKPAYVWPIHRSSKVPQYTFSNTLEKQKAELKENPQMLSFRESRKKMAGDPFLPIYHFVSPEGRFTDPNGLSFWQGKWHMFYQAFPPQDPRLQHWGHAISDDLINWKDLPLAIYPNPEERVFSGSIMIEKNRAIAIYPGINQGTMIATSTDPLLLNWKKLTGKAVIPFNAPGVESHNSDAFIWKKGDYYHAIFGWHQMTGPDGKRLRAEFLYRSKDLINWEELHQFLENDQYGLVGDDGACPYFYPIGEGDKHILLQFSHMSGGKYIIGDYDTKRDKLVVTDGGDFNHGAVMPGGVHAPSAYPDGDGGIFVIFNMNSGKKPDFIDNIMSIPRHMTLDGNDDLIMKPASSIKTLRDAHRQVNSMTLPVNEEVIFENINGNAMELVVEIDPGDANVIELNVLRSPNKEEYTKISFYKNRGTGGESTVVLDNSHSSILSDAYSRPPESAQVKIDKNETLKLRVFIDKSIVEVFVNDKQCVAARAYPGRDDSIGVSLRSQGNSSKLISLDTWQMKNIYQNDVEPTLD
jgi:beta-fructofuranosidase